MAKYYIDVDKAKSSLCSFSQIIKHSANISVNDIAEALPSVLDTEPSADVQEVKHGHWVKAEHRGCVTYNESYAECSNCHGEPLQFCRDFRYCPNCGAKMDERGDEE